ncbi:MAG: divalent-cation tolerance protein CutA [Nitrospirota bacterium]|jgi:periplasmic divalent cation tolerance protein
MGNIVVLVTAPSEKEGMEIARALVEERLAACVNVVGSLRSVFRWEGRIEDEGEVLLVAKSREGLFEALDRRVRDLHPYSVPEVIALPIVKGSEAYLSWLEEETS